MPAFSGPRTPTPHPLGKAPAPVMGPGEARVVIPGWGKGHKETLVCPGLRWLREHTAPLGELCL